MTPVTVTRPSRAIVQCRVDIALAALVIVVLGPIVASNSAQPASRLDLTAAVAEHGSVDITRYPIGIDYATVHGRRRSDKPPGQPLLSVPVYFVGRLFGAESAAQLRQHGSLTLWWVTCWSATVPFALLLVMMRRTAARFAPGAAVPATLALGFGTVMLPYAASLFAHALTAAVAFAAWRVLDREELTASRAAVGGLLAGAAVFVEYEAAIVAVVLLVLVALRARSRLKPFAAPAAIPALALAWYHSVAFGTPWRVSYAMHRTRLPGVGFHMPFRIAFEMLFSGARGYLLVSPLVLLALASAGWVASHTRRQARLHGRVALAIFGGYLIVAATSTDGSLSDFPGTRYLIVAVPFLSVPLAVVWTHVRRAAILCACWGGLIMAGATFTGVLVGSGEPLVGAYLERLRALAFEPTVWSIGAGRIGVACYVLSAVAAVAVLAFVAHSPAEERAVA